MFFHTLLLHPQHKMQLSLPWIAATLGVKKLKKDDIIKCNVIKVCDHILLFVTSDSLNPNKRFSLRLSAILISGISQILRQQVIYLRDDIDRSLLAREKHADRLLHEFQDDVETPPTPKPAVKRKKVKKPSVEETPESLVGRIAPTRGEKIAEPEFTLEPLRLPDVIQEEAIIQARVAEITLREETARPQEPQLTDDFGLGDVAVPPLPSDSRIQETVAQVHDPPKSPKKKKRVDEPLEEIQPQPLVQIEEREKRVETEMPQVSLQELQPTELVPPPPAETLPEEEITVVPAIPEKEPDKDKEEEKDAEKEKELHLEKRKTPVDITQLEVMEPVVESKVLVRKDKNICASLLLKTRKKKVVFINQKMQIYQDEPVFIPVTNKVPDFKPLTKFWPEWETMHLEVQRDRPVRDTESARVSATTEGSLALGVDKTAETPEIRTTTSFPSVQQIETPSEVTPGPRYESTPRKRPRPSDQTVEEILPPAANGDLRPPEMLPRKRRKVVSIEEVQAAELAKEIPEEQLVPQELPESHPVGVPEVSEIPLEADRTKEVHPPVEEITQEPVEKEKSPERRLPREKEDEESPPRPGYPKDRFGVKWSRRILKVVCQHEKIGPVDICKAIKKRLTKLNMSTVFAALLHLAKDQYVLLHSAEDSLELEVIEKGPKKYDF